ncbi:MAG: hypothetical protein AAF545_11420 [Pseudomonadota bacterium]
MSIVDELRRRNVFRIATAYAVVGWLILQVADVVFDFAGAPEWTGKALIALLLLGFPIAVVLSWVFESTPEGVRRDDGQSQPDSVRAQRLNTLTIAAALGVAGMFAWQQFGAPPAAVAPAPTRDAVADASTVSESPEIDAASIAVLPFADLSQLGDQDYFSDGIAEEILNVLANVEGLAVASRTSAFAFKGRASVGIPEIAAELGVRHVLEGSVRTAGDTIRITAQLIDAQSDKHLWSQTYDKKLTAQNVFEIQDEIASAIVVALSESLQLSGIASSGLAVRADTENLDAYQLFLRGRDRFRIRSQDNIPGTIALFESAIELDPNFARAWAGYAAVTAVAPSWGFPGETEPYYEVSQRAANKAIELDDSLALPYSVLAYTTRETIPLDFSRAFEMYEKALERDPNEVNTLLWRGIDRIAVGQFDLASEDFTRCRTLDQSYLNCFAFDANARLYAGDYVAARELFMKTAGLGNQSQSENTAIAMIHKEPRDTAILALSWAFQGSGWAFEGVGEDAVEPEHVYRMLRSDDHNYALELEALNAALARLGLGSVDLRLPLPALLFRQYEELEPNVFFMFWWHPTFDHFHASPHWQRVVTEMGIADYWRENGYPPQCRAVGEESFECDIPEL